MADLILTIRICFLSVFFLLGTISMDAQSVPSVADYENTEINKSRLYSAVITQSALYLGSMSYLQFVWYKDAERVPFHYYDDSKGYLQIDKMGHAYGAYIESYLCYKWLRSAGVSKKKALIFGGSMGLVLQTPIEVFDGLYENWGFSWSDMLANTAGAALVVGQEILFDRQLVNYKFSFSRSVYADQANGYLGDNTLESLLYDYNGHTYWLSTSLNNFLFKDKLPDWLCLSLGYSADGMFGEFENRSSYRGVAIPETSRDRQFLLAPDVDWTKIPTESRFLKGVFQALNFVKIPSPAIELTNRGQFKAHWLYF